MTKFIDYKLFVERTGMILDHQKLVEIGLIPQTFLGTFCAKQLDELIEFCFKNPNYHIVSQLNANLLVNRISIGAKIFFLAEGDFDRRLIFIRSGNSEFRAA